MSPFERATEALATRIRGLSLRAQVALFLSASEVLAESWREWSAAANRTVDLDTFDRGVAEAAAFASGDESVSRDVLAAVEASTPSEPSDVRGFTAAQDCWICLDTALRGALGDFDPADSAWYLLEPLFQAVSERLFGFADVGSDIQEEAESSVLADPALTSAIAAVERGIVIAASASATEPQLGELRSAMAAIRP